MGKDGGYKIELRDRVAWRSLESKMSRTLVIRPRTPCQPTKPSAGQLVSQTASEDVYATFFINSRDGRILKTHQTGAGALQTKNLDARREKVLLFISGSQRNT